MQKLLHPIILLKEDTIVRTPHLLSFDLYFLYNADDQTKFNRSN